MLSLVYNNGFSGLNNATEFHRHPLKISVRPGFRKFTHKLLTTSSVEWF